MKYIFKTICTMKPYNREKYWIERNCVKDKIIEADNLSEAIKVYAEQLDENDFICVSKTAIKQKSNMYIGDNKMIGYVFTGSTEMDGVKQYIQLWTEIMEVNYPKEFEVA